MDYLKHIGKVTQSLEDRGLHAATYFEVTFLDGVKAHEATTNWSQIAELREVKKKGRKYMAMVCTFPVKEIRIHHEGLESTISVPSGLEVYQAVANFGTYTQGNGKSSISGRVVGLIKDGVVVEERFLDGRTMEILGGRF